MGSVYSATCNECQSTFTVTLGGGFMYAVFHCDECGQEKGIILPCRDSPVPDPGSCSCGGRFTVDAPPRCPKCCSADLNLKFDLDYD